MNFHRHQLSDRSSNRLKISSWSVNGLSKNSVFDNKLQNCVFLHQFRDCDGSIMLQIWGSEVNEIPGFDIIALSPPRKLNTKRSGRSSGGILVAVKRSLAQYFSLVKQTSDCIWVKID